MQIKFSKTNLIKFGAVAPEMVNVYWASDSFYYATPEDQLVRLTLSLLAQRLKLPI